MVPRVQHFALMFRLVPAVPAHRPDIGHLTTAHAERITARRSVRSRFGRAGMAEVRVMLKRARNEPAFLVEIVRALAQIRGTTEAAIADATTRNAELLFGMSPP